MTTASSFRLDVLKNDQKHIIIMPHCLSVMQYCILYQSGIGSKSRDFLYSYFIYGEPYYVSFGNKQEDNMHNRLIPRTRKAITTHRKLFKCMFSQHNTPYPTTQKNAPPNTFIIYRYYHLFEVLSGDIFGQTYITNAICIYQPKVYITFILHRNNSLLYNCDMTYFTYQINLSLQTTTGNQLSDTINYDSSSCYNTGGERFYIISNQTIFINRIKYVPSCSFFEYLYNIVTMFKVCTRLSLANRANGYIYGTYRPALLSYSRSIYDPHIDDIASGDIDNTTIDITHLYHYMLKAYNSVLVWN